MKRGLAVVDHVVQAATRLLSGGGGRAARGGDSTIRRRPSPALTSALDEGGFHPALLYGVAA